VRVAPAHGSARSVSPSPSSKVARPSRRRIPTISSALAARSSASAAALDAASLVRTS
jgi:hypothetical protein